MKTRKKNDILFLLIEVIKLASSYKIKQSEQINIKEQMQNILKYTVNYIKTNILFFTFLITSLINEIMLRNFTIKNTFDISPFLADLSFLLIIASFGYFLKSKHQFKYFFTWSIILTIICIINAAYYINYINFVSVSLLETSFQLAGVDEGAVQNVIEPKCFYYLFQIVALLFVNQYLKRKNYYEKVSHIEQGKIRALNTLVIGLITLGIFISTLTSVDLSRLNKQWNREYLVTKFGVYIYQVNDAFATVKSQINPLFGYDEAARTFREYYEQEKEVTKNKYTNIFKGKNVIAIHAESMQTFLINTKFNDQYVVPNLRKLSQEGLYFSNFYAQESVGTSSDSEFTYSTSLMPASSGTVFVNYFEREYDTLQKQLKKKGYYTFSMHGNNCSFWNRSTTYKSIGYDDFYCHKKSFEIDDVVGLGLSDKSFFKQSIPIISKIKDEHKNFYGTMIMLSNHTPFNDKGEAYSDFDVSMKYEKVNEETGGKELATAPYMEGTKLGYYFKSAHYADEAIGQLIDDLDKNNLLEDTVVIIYGDHDAKLKKSEYNRFYNYNPNTDGILDKEDPNYQEVDYYSYELNRKVPFIIWTKDKQLKKEIKTVMGMYDVMPTLGNMFGFDTPYALGHDIFSTKDNIVVFPDGNWLTNKIYYNHSKEEVKLLNTIDTVTTDYIQEKDKYAEKILAISNSIIVYDLIKKTNETKNLVKEGN